MLVFDIYDITNCFRDIHDIKNYIMLVTLFDFYIDCYPM